MRSTFIKCLLDQASHDERIFLLTPDLGFSVLEPFAERFPDRFLNVGIAEQNAVGVAAGLALSGYIPYIYSIIPFVTMRCFEQVRIDLAYMNTNVRLIGVGAGYSYGPAGATHHAIEDIAIMRALPNMTVCCPGDPVEVQSLITASFSHLGPMYIRLGKNGEPRLHREDADIRLGQAVPLQEGEDLTLLVTSNMLGVAAEFTKQLAETRGKKISLVSVPTIKPLDRAEIIRHIDKGHALITLEEHNIIGGLGSAIAEVIAEYGKAVKFFRVAIPDIYLHDVGGQDYLRNKYILPALNLAIKQVIF